jgi:hypothetical protein
MPATSLHSREVTMYRVFRAQADWIRFIVGTSYEGAATLSEENAAARHHVQGSFISLHNKHRVAIR